eukprot:15143280-Alexandrium_andersonii.AAC.1
MPPPSLVLLGAAPVTPPPTHSPSPSSSPSKLRRLRAAKTTARLWARTRWQNLHEEEPLATPLKSVRFRLRDLELPRAAEALPLAVALRLRSPSDTQVAELLRTPSSVGIVNEVMTTLAAPLELMRQSPDL